MVFPYCYVAGISYFGIRGGADASLRKNSRDYGTGKPYFLLKFNGFSSGGGFGFFTFHPSVLTQKPTRL